MRGLENPQAKKMRLSKRMCTGEGCLRHVPRLVMATSPPQRISEAHSRIKTRACSARVWCVFVLHRASAVPYFTTGTSLLADPSSPSRLRAHTRAAADRSCEHPRHALPFALTCNCHTPTHTIARIAQGGHHESSRIPRHRRYPIGGGAGTAYRTTHGRHRPPHRERDLRHRFALRARHRARHEGGHHTRP